MIKYVSILWAVKDKRIRDGKMKKEDRGRFFKIVFS